jgi:hypothetical protein
MDLIVRLVNEYFKFSQMIEVGCGAYSKEAFDKTSSWNSLINFEFFVANFKHRLEEVFSLNVMNATPVPTNAFSCSVAILEFTTSSFF